MDGATATADELRRTKSSPLVRKIAQEHGVDISRLEGTGLSGRVTKNDILSFIESGTSATAAPVSKLQPQLVHLHLLSNRNQLRLRLRNRSPEIALSR